MRGITNARPKDGVQTINNLAPNANGNFTIEAGNGVTITAGTNKITIDAAGGGGSWTKRADNNNWSDLFSVSGSNITSLKDMIIMIDSQVWTDRGGITYIPKGITHTMIPVNVNNIQASSTVPVRLQLGLCAYIDSSHVTGSNLVLMEKDFSVSVDFNNQSVSYTIGSSGIKTLAKNNFIVFTKD